MKTTLEFEGPMWKDQVIRFLDALEFPSHEPEASTSTNTISETDIDYQALMDEELTIKERLEMFLKYEYPKVWFTSQDVREAYERVFDPIKLSTVSTYLSRMYRDGTLERRGNRSQREYRVTDIEEDMYIPVEESTKNLDIS